MGQRLIKVLCTATFHVNDYVHRIKIDNEDFYETRCYCGKERHLDSTDDNVALGYGSGK